MVNIKCLKKSIKMHIINTFEVLIKNKIIVDFKLKLLESFINNLGNIFSSIILLLCTKYIPKAN